MNPAAEALTRAVLIGAVSGLRSQWGMAAVAWSGRPVGASWPVRSWPARPWVRGAMLVSAAGEFVADKSPGVPSRLTPGGWFPVSFWEPCPARRCPGAPRDPPRRSPPRRPEPWRRARSRVPEPVGVGRPVPARVTPWPPPSRTSWPWPSPGSPAPRPVCARRAAVPGTRPTPRSPRARGRPPQTAPRTARRSSTAGPVPLLALPGARRPGARRPGNGVRANGPSRRPRHAGRRCSRREGAAARPAEGLARRCPYGYASSVTPRGVGTEAASGGGAPAGARRRGR